MTPAEARFAAETALLPWLVAEAVCGEAARALESEVPRSFAPRLAARAVRLYAVNPPFARRLRTPGNVGREWLRTFLRHWLASRLARQYPALFHRLPSSFCVGWPLPPHTPPLAAGLDRQIDELTCDLYGLTPEERALVADT